jgi:excisionase family DNA binding protein
MAKRATSSQFYSVSELAAILSVHPSTVREQAAAGHLPAIRVGRVWRLPR